MADWISVNQAEPGQPMNMQNMPVGEATSFLLDRANIPTGLHPSAQTGRDAEARYRSQLAGQGPGILSAARSEAANISRGAARSTFTGGGRNLWAGTQGALDAGLARSQVMLGAQQVAGQADERLAAYDVEQGTEGEKQAAEVAKGLQDLNTYEISGNRSGYPPTNGQIYQYIVTGILPQMTTPGSAEHWQKQAAYYYLLSKGYSPGRASSELGLPSRGVAAAGAGGWGDTSPAPISNINLALSDPEAGGMPNPFRLF